MLRDGGIFRNRKILFIQHRRCTNNNIFKCASGIRVLTAASVPRPHTFCMKSVTFIISVNTTHTHMPPVCIALQWDVSKRMIKYCKEISS